MYTVRARTLVVVLTVALCGAALLAATTPAVAAQEYPELNVSYEYQIEQDEPQDVRIEVTVHNPDDVDDTISVSKPDYVEIEDDDDLESVDGSLQVKSGVDTATVVYSLPVERLAKSYSSRSIELIAPDYSWAVIGTHSLIGDRYYYDLNETHGTNQGDRFEAGNVGEPHFLFGPVEAATAHGETATIHVLGPPEEMQETPEAVAEALADVSDVVEAGVTDHEVTAYAVPHIDGSVGVATGNEVHYTEYDQSLYDTGSTWIHEYVHNTDDTALGRDMQWFTEGYADYGAVRFGTETGYQEFDQYRSSLEMWSGERVVLADEDAWDDTGDSENYNQGARVLAALDYEIHNSTDGEATIQDVVAEMHDAHTADLETFTDIVADLADEDVAADAETWITTTEPILEDGVWDHQEHEEIIGGAPHLEADIEIAAVDGDEERTLDVEAPNLGLSTEQELQTSVVFENEGSVDATIDPFQVHDLSGRTVSEFTPVTIEANETETVSFAHQFEDAGIYDVSIDDVVMAAFVEDAKTILSVSDADAADRADAIRLADGAADFVVHTGSSGSTFRIETLDGEFVAEGDDAGHTENVDVDALDQPATYEVTIDTGDETYTRYVTTLDRVENTVPIDLNGDEQYRDFNGDGKLSQTDVNVFSQNRDRPEIQEHVPAYDYTDDGVVDDDDVQALFDYVAAA